MRSGSISQAPFVTITRDFEGANPNCSANINSSWVAAERVGGEGKIIIRVASSTLHLFNFFTGFSETITTADGLDWLSSTFKLCEPLKTRSEVSNRLLEWLSGTWFNLAMGELYQELMSTAKRHEGAFNYACRAATASSKVIRHSMSI